MNLISSTYSGPAYRKIILSHARKISAMYSTAAAHLHAMSQTTGTMNSLNNIASRIQPPQTTATQPALLHQGQQQCGAFIFPSLGSSCSFSIRDHGRQKCCWGRMLQQNKLVTAHKSSNYCPRLLLQKQFITQVFLLITMWMQFPW